MSQWTHVAGIVRMDGMPSLGQAAPDLGKTCSYEDSSVAWDECNVPCGSEGSLEVALNTNPNESLLACWIAVISGDLRDYDDVDEIVAYFTRIVEGQMVRQGTFTVDVEGQMSRTFVFQEKWVELANVD